jgi:hypothetical protein
VKRPVEANRSEHRWIIAAALALALIALVAFLSLAQVASSGAGKRIMARTTATMTEIDSAMPQIQESLREAADQSGVDPIPVPDFPVPVEVPRDIVISGNTEQIRDEILSRSADGMYDEGVSVWDDADPDASQNIARTSAAGGIRAALSLIGDTPRTVFLALTAIAALAAAALAVAFTLQMPALRRLTALGAALAAAGVPAAAGFLVVRLMTDAAVDEPFGDALTVIAADAEDVGLRNSLIVAALGLALLALGTVGSALERGEKRPIGLSSETDE